MTTFFCSHGFLELRDLFSLSSSPMSPKCNLKRTPDDLFVGSPKHPSGLKKGLKSGERARVPAKDQET
jgi:hypothetical protein